MLNLVVNALALHETRGRCWSLVGWARDGKHARIEVWDSVSVLRLSITRRSSRSFIQVGNRERDRSKGLGLGLNIVERNSAPAGTSGCNCAPVWGWEPVSA